MQHFSICWCSLFDFSVYHTNIVNQHCHCLPQSTVVPQCHRVKKKTKNNSTIVNARCNLGFLFSQSFIIYLLEIFTVIVSKCEDLLLCFI